MINETRLFQFDESFNGVMESIRNNYARKMTYGWKSNESKLYDFGHWNNKILMNSFNYIYDHGKMPFIEKLQDIKIIWDIIQQEIGERCLLKVYVNGYTYGTDAYLHKDDPWITKEYGENSVNETIIVYLNEVWNPDWAGETVIVSEDGEIELSILPKKNKVLVFDSNKLHAARPVTRSCPELRTVLVFKTVDKKCLNKEVDFIYNQTIDEKHSGRTFFEHLYRTCVMLEDSKERKDVCSAGLFHSVYGTEYYEYKNKIDRKTVQQLIGTYSENLAYEFCTLKNRLDSLLNNTKNYNDSVRRDLMVIEYANLLEQGTNHTQKIEQLKNEILKLKHLK